MCTCIFILSTRLCTHPPALSLLLFFFLLLLVLLLLLLLLPPLSSSQWEVATLVLDILYKLLSSHEFAEEDFTDITYHIPNRDSEVAILPKSPGHSLLLHLMNTSQFLRKVSSPYLFVKTFPLTFCFLTLIS